MLWLNFILRLNFIFLCFKLIMVIQYRTPKQRKITFKPRVKMNRNVDKKISWFRGKGTHAILVCSF